MRALLLSTVFLFPPALAFAADIDAASRIDRVTVYPDGATITRNVSLDVPAGQNTVVLRGLPAGIDVNSLRVEGQANGTLTIASVDSRVVPGDAKPVVDAALEEKLKAAHAEGTMINGQIEALEAQKAVIKRYAEASPEKLSAEAKPLDPEKWPAVWELVGRGLADVNARLDKLKARDQELYAIIAALEAAKPKAPAPGAPKLDVVISVDAASALKADLAVSYQVRQAAWSALYDARLITTGDKPKLELVRRASVQQRTGEDWAGAAVQLSTVRLRRGTSARDLPTLSLKLVELQSEVELLRQRSIAAAPPPAAAKPALEPGRADASGLAKAEGDQDGEVRLKEKRAVAAIEAGVDAGAYQSSFTVPGRVDIPQDGTAKSFRLSVRIVEPKLSVKATPEYDLTAYLEAAFQQDDEAPLLPGEVSLTRDGGFVGKGRMGLVATGDMVKLGFGADDQVKITRVPVRKNETDGGFFGQNRTDTQDFKTTVKNLHGFPLRISVQDRVPVSENSAVTVETLQATTPPTEKVLEDKRGVMGWSYEYKPGETREIRLAWRVRWPADRELRRENQPLPRP